MYKNLKVISLIVFAVFFAQILATNLFLPFETGKVHAATEETSTSTTEYSSDELLLNPSFDAGTTNWSFYVYSVSAKAIGTRDTVEYYTAPACYKIESVNKGTAQSHIQFYTAGINIEEGKTYNLQFKAKSTVDFKIPSIYLMMQGSPYTRYATPATNLSVTSEWNSYSVNFKSNTTDSNARVTFFIGGALPEGEVLYIDSLSLKEVAVATPTVSATETPLPTATLATAIETAMVTVSPTVIPTATPPTPTPTPTPTPQTPTATLQMLAPERNTDDIPVIVNSVVTNSSVSLIWESISGASGYIVDIDGAKIEVGNVSRVGQRLYSLLPP